jgi:hypothetical protein
VKVARFLPIPSPKVPASPAKIRKQFGAPETDKESGAEQVKASAACIGANHARPSKVTYLLGDIVDESVSFLEAIVEDVTESVELAKAKDSQFNRRTYIRTLLAVIEGIINSFKQSCIEAHCARTSTNSIFSDAELAMLKEEAYGVNDKGEAYSQLKTISTLENFHFTMKMVMRAAGKKFSLNKNDAGWQALKETVKMRNRLIHPKKASDLVISDDEKLLAADAATWFMGTIMNNLKAFAHIIEAKNLTSPDSPE